MSGSLSSHSSSSSQHGHPSSVVWYISFGDLLTLLLCFFLVLTPWKNPNNRHNVQSLSRFSLFDDPTRDPGTPLASGSQPRGSVTILELPLFRQFISEPIEYGMEDVAERVRQGGVHEGRASLLLCDSAVDRQGLIEAFYQTIRRELGDRVEVNAEVRWGCEDTEVLVPITEPVLGRVRITRF